MAMVFGRAYGMNRTMSFLPELRNFLKENGLIYTVRRYRMSDAIVEVDGIGECHRVPLGRVFVKEDLIRYYDLSGFKTVDDWWKKIKYFIPGSGSPMYLYEVKIGKGE